MVTISSHAVLEGDSLSLALAAALDCAPALLLVRGLTSAAAAGRGAPNAEDVDVRAAAALAACAEQALAAARR